MGQDEPKMGPKGQSSGLCWWLFCLLFVRTAFLKNGVSPRREPHFRLAIRLRWRHVGVKLTHVGPWTDLCWLTVATLDACWPVLAQVGATLSL